MSVGTVSVGTVSVDTVSVGTVSVGTVSAYESAPGSIEPEALSIRYIAGTTQPWRPQTPQIKKGAPRLVTGAPLPYRSASSRACAG